MEEEQKPSYVKWVVIAAVALFAIIGGLMWASYSNQEVQLRNQIGAQQKNLTNIYDQTWKIIAQKAQVADKYEKAFKQIYPALMQGRYGSARGGALLSFITESNPNFDTSLFASLSNAIEGQRKVFADEQTLLIDMKREHDNLRQMFPSSLFVGGRSEVQIVVVTSDKTDAAFKTGKDNDIKVF